jgi:hypothetical protein
VGLRRTGAVSPREYLASFLLERDHAYVERQFAQQFMGITNLTLWDEKQTDHDSVRNLFQICNHNHKGER